MSHLCEAYAVAKGNPDNLKIVSTGSGSLSIHADEESAINELKKKNEYVVKVAVMTAGTLAALQGSLDNDRKALKAEIERHKEDDLFYESACDEMQRQQRERAKAGKAIGTEGSLIDGLSWVYTSLSKEEDENKNLRALLKEVRAMVSCMPQSEEIALLTQKLNAIR
ncbi:hypothetical protein ACI2KR_06445 [Pseudomonas luteola]